LTRRANFFAKHDESRFLGDMRHFTPVPTISAALAGLDALGIDSERARAAVGIDADLLEDPWASVPLDAFRRLWDWARDERDDPLVAARAAMNVPFGGFGIVDHLVASSDTVGDGLHALSLFFRLLSSATRLELALDGDEASILVRNNEVTDATGVFHQWTLGCLANRFCARDAGERSGPVRVELAHEAHDCDELEGVFDVPVVDGRDVSKIVFPRQIWGRPMRSPDPTLHENLRRLAERADIQRFEVEPIACAVRAQLPRAMDADGSPLERVARNLSMSERTLQRRLGDAELTFTELLDDFRRSEATRLLAESDKSIVQVAYALGFSEQSSFTRAFKRWTGAAPGEWRSGQ
jgi:AraC-like DNA-binding protein